MSKVKSDDLFFFDNKGETPSAQRKSGYSDENELADSICKLKIEGENKTISAFLPPRVKLLRLHGNLEQSNGKDEEEEAIPLVLPAHSCVYCKIYNPLCVAKCIKCSKWFCNSQKGGLSGHLVNHLIRSGHKEVSLHPNSPVGDATLECYNCGCKNIFLLGYIQSKEDEVIVLLCRQPCAFNAPKKSVWNVDNWTPLIVDRRLHPWLCKFPSQAQESRARKIPYDKIKRLEAAWKSGMTSATLDDINRKEQKVTLGSTKLSYSDSHEFKSIMVPLITADAKIKKEQKEAQVRLCLSIIVLNFFTEIG
jgi:regulator of nonsense transcripts 1